MDFWSHLFDTSGFPPRWQCGLWTDTQGWLHILSDLGVWAAYFAIPCILIYFVLRRRDVPFSSLFWLFGAFILACGTTHLMEAIIFWHPLYRLAGLIKLGTALISWATVAALVPVIPKALAMRTPEELEREVAARRAAQHALQQANAELERRVQERTAELMQANAALHQERDGFQITLSSIGDAVIVTDAVGQITMVNPVAEALTGWSAHEAVGRPLDIVFPIENEDTGQPVESPVGRVLREGIVVGLANHTVLTARDGTRRPIDDSAAPIKDEAGRPQGCVLVFHDVSKQRRAERELRASQARLSAVIDNSPASIFVKDRAGRHLLVNRPFAQEAGRSVDQIIGHTDEAVFPAEIAARFRQIDQEILATGATQVFEESFEFAGRQRTYLTTKFALHDAEGRPEAVCGIATDITERKRAEEAVRERERQLRLVADTAPVLIAQFDCEGRYKFVNKPFAEWFGLHPRDIIGRRIPEVVGAEAYATFRHQVEAALAGRSVEFDAEIPYERLGPQWMHCAYEPEVDAAGRVVGLVAALTNIADRKRAEQDLRASRERLDFVVNSSGVGLWYCDLPFDKLVWNAQVKEHFGLPPDAEVTIQTFFDHLHPDDRERTRAAIDQAIRDRLDYDIEYRTVGRDGRQRWIRAIGRAAYGAAGTPIHFDGLTVDNTSRKLLEEQLRESEARLAAVIDYSPACIFAKAPDGRYLLANRALALLVGRQPEDFPGRTDADFFSPEVAQRFGRDDARVLMTGQPVTYEESFPQNGRTLTFLTVKFPLADSGGRVYGVCGIATDITARRQTESALRESDERLRLALEAGQMDVWDWNVQANEAKGAEQLEPAPGLPPGSRGGTFAAFQALIHPDDREHVLGTVQRALAAQADYDIEFRNVWPDGSVHWTAGKGKVFTDEQGRALRLVGIGMDVTARRAAEETVRSLLRISGRLNSTLDVEALLDILVEEAIQLAGAESGVSGLRTPEGMVCQRYFQNGQPLPLTYCWPPLHGLPGWLLVHKAPYLTNDAQNDGQIVQELCVRFGVRSALSMPILSVHHEVLGFFEIHNKRGGEFTPVDQENLRAVSQAAAVAIQNALAYRQVRHAEEGLRQRVERLRLLNESAAHLLHADRPDEMVRGLFQRVKDHLGVDTYFNFMVNEAGDALRLESCAGIPPQEAGKIQRLEFGQAICGTVALERRPIVATCIQQSDDPKAQLVKGFGINAYACNPLLAEDRLLGTLSFASHRRERFDDGELEFLRTLCHYVTVAYERLRLLSELREADRRKDEFLAMLAHELRNPLAPIRNALQILRMRNTDGVTAERAREMMERQLQHLVRLVDDLLDVSRIMRNKIELRKEAVDLRQVVERAVELAQPVIDAQGHELSRTVPTAPLPVEADSVRLAQVVANLLSNAAKYTEKAGHIRLVLEQEGADGVLRVQDNGVGIPSDLLPRVFDLFVQGDRSSARTQGGLGIGLTLVKRLVEMHGGTVTAFSEGPGKGSEFVVRQPLVRSTGPAPTSAGQDGAGRPQRRRVVVVDDNVDAADSLAMVLRLMGHDVRTAHDGPSGLEAVKEYQPDIVLLDIGLPGMDGYEVARRLRLMPEGRSVRLVAVSGYGQEEARRQAQAAGFDQHATKPVDPVTLASLFVF